MLIKTLVLHCIPGASEATRTRWNADEGEPAVCLLNKENSIF